MNRDGTGPEGRGPKTGRGLGPCATPANKLQIENEKLKAKIKELKAQLKK